MCRLYVAVNNEKGNKVYYNEEKGEWVLKWDYIMILMKTKNMTA